MQQFKEKRLRLSLLSRLILLEILLMGLVAATFPVINIFIALKHWHLTISFIQNIGYAFVLFTSLQIIFLFYDMRCPQCRQFIARTNVILCTGCKSQLQSL